MSNGTWDMIAIASVVALMITLPWAFSPLVVRSIFGVIAVVITLVAIGSACLRASKWSKQESVYWRHVQTLVQKDVRLDRDYRPLLEWAQANRPRFLYKVFNEWEPPAARRHTRMMRNATRVT